MASNFRALDWTPTLSGGAAMTIASPVIDSARYLRVGNFVWIELSFSATLGGTANPAVYSTLPVTPAAAEMPISGYVIDNGAVVAALVNILGGQIGIHRYDFANWTLAANQRGRISGWYEAA